MKIFKEIARFVIFCLACIPAFLFMVYSFGWVICHDWIKRLVNEKQEEKFIPVQEIEGKHRTKYTEDIPAYNIRVEKPDGKTFWIPKEDIRTIAKNFCGMK